MAIIYRTSALAQRHAEIGGELEDWNGMGTAWFYDHSDERAKADYEAVRTKAGLMDVSGLKKIHLSGPHAAAVIDRATTRNVDKLMPGRAVYAAMLDDRGLFIDDCVIYRLSVNNWLLVHGTGTGHESLAMAAYGKNVSMIFDDDLHDMSLQGPVAVDFLAKHVPGIRDLAYFGIIQTKLFGKPVMISRTGYTGERGYEIFCEGRHAIELWDAILEDGKDMGIRPVQFSTLDLLRTESYLLFYPGDNSETYPFDDGPCGDSLWELGLEFTVSPGKKGFRGAENHYALEGKERFKIYGVRLEGTTAADEGAELLKDGKPVGVVTYGMRSDLFDHTVGIARMPVDCAVPGTQLTVRNADGTEIPCVAEEMPFYDKDKSIRTAKG
ncbi:aminomethyltransferase family protein [Mameliella sediminis]|uniref:aminomethyltransferase family protein n=1 Tax=Mameliella sediminis TaxID=2836866 RepID=UPI001C45EE6A|nr:aminomethyltransferase family protein [Mameliella sediminis]MBY6144861.1 aminomethyltransferase family protein [Mameliella alba]MBV7395976.1 aminomethyltransferase family protein [Mameliella sediminis]MBY6160387.1 aminomethyltransferase family protein [Mameliella alba]MBY6168857.1 aminomethyltransferase family protein [Mameliella alba]MBY6173922.1 aminomethyltransferase family protein [Mameliella alba]